MLYLPSEFPLADDLCYLNHAAIGPWPRRAAQAVAAFAQQNMMRGGSAYPDWLAVEQRLRQRIRGMIRAASMDDIALVQNTSHALSIVSQGLDWQAGDVVVGVADDFCSNRMPWEQLTDRGVSYRPVAVNEAEDPEALLIAALEDGARLLAISTVHFATGRRFDLARLSSACSELGVLLCVDAIQSLGACVFDLEQTPADFVACGGHKWLLAPEGLGFLYCRPELRDRLQLRQFGWAMRDRPYEFESLEWRPARSARRFEAGTPNMLGIHALDASLSLFEEFGMTNVEQRLANNVSWLEAQLLALPGVATITPADPTSRAGILTFRHARLPGAQIHEALMHAGVICSPRAGGVRLAPHFYTPQSVLQRAVEYIARVIEA